MNYIFTLGSSSEKYLLLIFRHPENDPGWWSRFPSDNIPDPGKLAPESNISKAQYSLKSDGLS